MENTNSSAESTEKTFLERMMEYRKTKKFTDLKIRIGEEEFHAHKIVLIQASPVFETMISEKWLKENTIQLDAEFVDPSIFEDLLNFLYNDKIVINHENVIPLAKAADFFNIRKLFSLAENYLMNSYLNKLAISCFEFSKTYSLEKLRVHSLNRIAVEYWNNKEELDVTKFDPEEFEIIVKRWGGYTDKERCEAFCDYIITWVTYDEENRKSIFPKLLSLLRLKRCSTNFLKSKILDNIWIKESLNQNCNCQILMEALIRD